MDVPDSELPVSRVSIEEAATSLPELIARVAKGERILIEEAGRLVAELTGRVEEGSRSEGGDAEGAKPKRSIHGALKGEIWIADDFDELGPEWDPYIR